jgi:hypothetical protein
MAGEGPLPTARSDLTSFFSITCKVILDNDDRYAIIPSNWHAALCLSTMLSRHAVSSKLRGILPSRKIAFLPLVNPLFATLTDHPHQYHSKGFSLPLFSYSYALFCHGESTILCIINSFRTLCAKHRVAGMGAPLASHQKTSSYFDRPRLRHLYSFLFPVEEPCT